MWNPLYCARLFVSILIGFGPPPGSALGGVLGGFGGPLEVSWRPLGGSGRALGRSWRPLGRSRGALGVFLEVLGAFLERVVVLHSRCRS